MRGLSLVETVVSLGVFSLLVVFLIALVPSLSRSGKRAEMEMQAGTIAQSYLETQRAANFESLASGSLPTLQRGRLTFDSELLVFPTVSDEARRVRVVVSLRDSQQPFTTFRETVICRVPRS